MKVAALFAGLGGIELGLSRSRVGAKPVYMCEWWEPARSVLAHQFDGVDLSSDIRDVTALPPADLVSAGFPCTDISQAGRTAGLAGDQSGLVLKALDLIEHHSADWLLLENVRNILVLHGGAAMSAICDRLDDMGFRWAYRLVDSRFTGVPQRRQRVFLLASRREDPRPVLFADNSEEPGIESFHSDAFGFYWTEGFRGLGWAQDAVPTLKGGSTIGIASPPAVWMPNAAEGRRIVTPHIECAESMQGLPVGWTHAAESLPRGRGARWKLTGNAVTAGVAEWIGGNLASPQPWNSSEGPTIQAGRSWPNAGWGERGIRRSVECTMWPVVHDYWHLAELLGDRVSPLSVRATSGFLSRLERGNLKVPDAFRKDLASHMAVMIHEVASV